MCHHLHNWLGIAIGLVLVMIGYFTSLRYLPKKSESPDVTLSHLKHLHLASLVLVIGGLFIVVLSLVSLTLS